MKEFFIWNKKIAIQGVKIARRDIRLNWLGQLFPLKPTSLNLLVNDVCNSQCQMCAVWKQKKDKEFSPDELERILKNTLFDKLNYIGVSGGEPTLRKDLSDIFRVIAQKHNSIRGTGIITNAIQKEQVIDRIEKSASICQQQGLRFNVMVSLDGIEEIHDKIRGHKGNYESAVEVIHYFKNKTNIPITVGCTITRDNVWHVDEVSDFCKREGITCRFRVAEFIDRLYNSGQRDVIRNFSEQERYHLGLFFVNLERLEKSDSPRKRTYRNIRKMLLEEAKRSTRCHWQTTAVTLDCRGQLLYCAPHSPILGNCLKETAHVLLQNNISKRRKILKENCASCIHDYGSTEILREWLTEIREEYWREKFSIDRMLVSSRGSKKITPTDFVPTHPPEKFLIVGWFGTETAGDKAILAEIIFQLQKISPNSHITLASIHPYYSQWTLREMGLKGIDIIPTFSAKFLSKIKEVDEVIMGGGPLMDLNSLGFVLAAFSRAKSLKKKTRIYGCGIGPLEKNPKFEETVSRILHLSDIIELRDSNSVKWATQQTGRDDIKNTGDPAINFVKRWLKENTSPGQKAFINLYLREWSTEYQGGLTIARFKETKSRFERALAREIHKLSTKFNLTPRLFPMHHFSFGKDDRDYNRWFARNYLQNLDPYVEKKPISVHEILNSMQEGKISICMRFHSVLFADTLGVPFIAIDYTNGGKIAGYLADCNKTGQMYTLMEIAEGKMLQV